MSEAIGFLRMNGVNPPSEILSYLQNEEVRGYNTYHVNLSWRGTAGGPGSKRLYIYGHSW